MRKIDKTMIYKLKLLLIEIISIEKMLKLIILKENLHISQIMVIKLGKTLITSAMKSKSSKKKELRIKMRFKDLENSAITEKEKILISRTELEQLTMTWQRLKKEMLN